MATTKKRTAKKKPAAKKPETTKVAKAPRVVKPRKASAIAAAARVLADAKEPLTTKQMIEAMTAKGYWSSPAGKTPERTLYSAILREIATKGKDVRFKKVERGQFALAGK